MPLDALIDLAISYGNAHGGRMRGVDLRPLSVSPQKHGRPFNMRMPPWTLADLQFVQDNLATLSLAEIAAVLGRSANAVKIIVVRKGIPVASKQPGWLTGNAAARALGVDIHTILKLNHLGRLPFEKLPGARGILRIRQVTLYRWATRWQNWLYFKPCRMGDPHLRRLVELAQSRWTDAWWSVGDIANYFHVDERAVNAQVRRKRVAATRWGNWYILRSDALRMKFFHGKGCTCLIEWSPRADAFILRARSEGKTIAEIARIMHWKEKRVLYRWHILRKQLDPTQEIAHD